MGGVCKAVLVRNVRIAACSANSRFTRAVTGHLPAVRHILRARILVIARGYKDADGLDHLRRDPGFKLARSRLLDTEWNLYSQPTMSHWENAQPA